MENNVMTKFEILEKIKDIDYGQLYKINYAAENQNELALLKCINYHDIDDSEIKDALLNQIEIIKKINGNDYVVNYYKYYDAKEDESIYVIFECLESIESKFSNGNCSEKTTIEIAKNLLMGLTTLHMNGIIHNNIKPNNIYISANGYKLGDFDALANYNATIDVKTDIYQVGLLMYHLLVGHLPFEARSYNEVLLSQKQGQSIPYLENVSSQLMNIIMKALELDKLSQYNDVGEMIKDLNDIVIDDEATIVTSNGTKRKSTDTLNFNSPIANKKIYDNLINIHRKYTLSSIFKRIFLILFLIGMVVLCLFLYGLTVKCSEGKISKYGICVKGHYKCPSGYKLNGSKCQKTIEQVEALENYYCPDDYVYSNGVCVYKETKTPKLTYMCADDFTLNDDKCIQEISADAAVVYSCPNNYVLAGTVCVTINSFDASKSYTCPDSSYTKNGTVCTKDTQVSTPAIVTYGCSRGGSFYNGSCYLTQNPTYDQNSNPICPTGYSYNEPDGKCFTYYSPTPTYSCLTGTSDGNGNCIRTSNSSTPATTVYSCPDGYTLVGNKCTNSATINAKSKYMCTDEMEQKDGKCYGKVTTDAIELYTCPKGYVLSGTVCIKDDFKEPEVKYTCSRVYTLNNDKCEKYKVLKATPIYD